MRRTLGSKVSPPALASVADLVITRPIVSKGRTERRSRKNHPFKYLYIHQVKEEGRRNTSILVTKETVEVTEGHGRV